MVAATVNPMHDPMSPLMAHPSLARQRIANQQQMDKLRALSVMSFDWLKKFVSTLRLLVQRVFAKLGIARGGIQAGPEQTSDAPTRDANFLDGQGGAGSGPAGASPESDQQRFAAETPPAADAGTPAAVAAAALNGEAVAPSAEVNALANNLMLPDAVPVVTFECLPEQLEAVRNALFEALKPLFDNPVLVVEENWPSAKVTIAAETMGEQCERMRYAHRLTSCEILRHAKDAIAQNPKAYAGLSAASLVESLRQQRNSISFPAGSFESRILQQIEVQATIRQGYDAYIGNAMRIMDAASNPIDRRAIKQIMMSAATNTRVGLEQLEDRLLGEATPEARARFADVNTPNSSGFYLPPFTKTIMENDEAYLRQPPEQRAAAPAAPAPASTAAAAPAVAAVPVVSQEVATPKSGTSPIAQEYLSRRSRVDATPEPEPDEGLNAQVVQSVAAATAAAAAQKTVATPAVSAVPFPSTTANPVAAALARAKGDTPAPAPAPAEAKVEAPQPAAPAVPAAPVAAAAAVAATVAPEVQSTAALPTLSAADVPANGLIGVSSRFASMIDDEDAETEGMVQ